MKPKTLIDIEKSVIRCTRCPELRAYTAEIAREKKRAYLDSDYWGNRCPRSAIRTLACSSSVSRLARTAAIAPGRPFTGDASGDFLYPALYRAGFASAPKAVDLNDGLTLRDCLITAAGRCAPPGNKPTPARVEELFSVLARRVRRAAVAARADRPGFDWFRRDPQSAAPTRIFAGSDSSAVRPRRRIHGDARRTVHRDDRVVSSEPAEHQYGETHRAMFDAIFTRANELLGAVDVFA